MTSKKISVLAFISILLVFATIGFLRRDKLTNDFRVTTGNIYEFGNSRGSGNTIFFKYRFSVNGQMFHGNSSLSCNRAKRVNFQSWTNGKKVQVVYEESNPNNSDLLLSREDYRQYAVEIPIEYNAQVKLIDSLCIGE